MSSESTSFSKPTAIVVAQCPNRGIGFNGQLPWDRLPRDMKRFKEISMKTQKEGLMNAVIMGRKTWESIPEKFRPLPSRMNIVLTSNPTTLHCNSELVHTAPSLEAGIALAESLPSVESIFLIGGERVFKEGIEGIGNIKKTVDRIYLTRVAKQFECDVFMPGPIESMNQNNKYIPIEVSKTMSEGGVPFDFVTFEKSSQSADSMGGGGTCEKTTSVPSQQFISMDHEEYQYLNLIKEIVRDGNFQNDRTEVGTYSLFGKQLRFSLIESFPILTTKRVFWRGVMEELLWFLRGDTNAKNLSDKKIHIWDGNGSKEFLEKRGLSHREEGDLGPVYGFQWRHFGAEYKTMHDNYEGQGYDQVKEVIETLKKNPADRRMIISAWNPAALSEMALPPCHMFCQFYVKDPDVENPANSSLSCLMYQRSCDVGLGVPFNIASYAALTCMIAQCCGMKPGELVHTMGNTHVYQNHVEPLMKEQVDRLPRPFPVLKINPEKKEIDGFEFTDFELVGYHPHPKVAMEMAV